MSLELGFHRLAFERTLAENKAETVVEGTLTLPKSAPEIGRGLILSASPRITEVEVKSGKVVFEGTIDYQFLYAHYEERTGRRSRAGRDEFPPPDDEDDAEVVVEETLERAVWERETPFAYILDLPGVVEGQEVRTAAKALSAAFEVRSDQATLDVEVTVLLSASAAKVEEARLAKLALGREDVEATYETVRVRSRLGAGAAEAVAQGALDLLGRAAPERVIEISAEPAVTETSVEDGFVRVKGALHYSAFYVGAEDAGPQYNEWRRGAGFEAVVRVDGAVKGAAALVEAVPGPTRFQVVDEDGQRSLAVQTPVRIDVTVEDVHEARLVSGLASKAKEIAIRKETVVLREAVGEGAATQSGRASLDLPEGYPGIERILYGDAEAYVDDVHVLGDRVAVELHVDLQLVYVGRSGKGGVQVVRWPKALTLDVEIPVDGAEPGLERRVAARVEQVLFDLASRESVDADVAVTVTAALFRDVEKEIVVEAVEVLPAEPDPPTYTFAVVQRGDTLWKLAAKYRSDPRAILSVNEWLEGEDTELPAGAKLCVPRRVPDPAA